MNAVLITKTTSDWVEVLEAAGVPCGPVYDYAQMFADPQMRHRGLVAIRAVEIDRPAAEAGIAMLERGGDFAKGIIRHEADRAKCDRFVTFDQGFPRHLHPGKVVLSQARPRS
jgi:hypothetical protein